MEMNDYKYGFTMSLHEYHETIPTLWTETKVCTSLRLYFDMRNSFSKIHNICRREMLWISSRIVKNFVSSNCSENLGDTYNNCHFVNRLSPFNSNRVSGRTLKSHH